MVVVTMLIGISVAVTNAGAAASGTVVVTMLIGISVAAANTGAAASGTAVVTMLVRISVVVTNTGTAASGFYRIVLMAAVAAADFTIPFFSSIFSKYLLQEGFIHPFKRGSTVFSVFHT